MNYNKFNKIILLVLLVLFIGTFIAPIIKGNNNETQDTLSLTFYTFDKNRTKKCKVELPTTIADEIFTMFDKLKNKIIYNPNNDETNTLKKDFIDILEANGLISPALSKRYVLSLLNPRWLQRVGNNNPIAKDIVPCSKNGNYALPMQSNTGSAYLCSIAGGGYGIIFPNIMLPRPRLITLWTAYIDAETNAVNLYTGHGFTATGAQIGISLGFIGIGLSFAFPGEPSVFGFGGYALSAFVKGENVEINP